MIARIENVAMFVHSRQRNLLVCNNCNLRLELCGLETQMIWNCIILFPIAFIPEFYSSFGKVEMAMRYQLIAEAQNLLANKFKSFILSAVVKVT